MGKYSKLVEFSTQNLFQIHAYVISAQKAKHLDVTTMLTYSHANMPLGQSECAYYLSYFIRALRGKQHIPSKNWPKCPPPHQDTPLKNYKAHKQLCYLWRWVPRMSRGFHFWQSQPHGADASKADGAWATKRTADQASKWRQLGFKLWQQRRQG